MGLFYGRRILVGLAVTVAMVGLSGCAASEEAPEHQNTIFTVGNYWDGSKAVACFWTGTTRTDLAGDGTHYAFAYGIFVD